MGEYQGQFPGLFTQAFQVSSQSEISTALLVGTEMNDIAFFHWGKTRFCKPSASRIYFLVVVGFLAFSCCATVPMRLHLISVSNSVQGTGIRLNIVGAGDESERFSVILKNGTLSPACGKHFERCKKLMVAKWSLGSLDDPIVQLVPFILVKGGLTLADVRATTGGIKVQGITDVIPSDTSNPAAIYETRYRPELASIEITGNTEAIVHFYDIIFNIASIRQTKLSKIHSLTVSPFNLSELSNFEYVSLHSDDDSQYVCFAVSNLLISFNPFSVTETSVELPNCTGGYRLTYARDSLLMATCQSGSVVYVDLDVMTVVNQTLPSVHPYTCPDPIIDLKAHLLDKAPFIRYYLWSTGKQWDIDLHGWWYAFGHCFGTELLNVFTYVDKEQGTYVIDLSDTPKLDTVQLSSAPCPSSGCYPLVVLEHQYQLVTEGEEIESTAIVVDYMDNFATIIKAEHFSSDMVTIAELPTSSKPNPPNSSQDKDIVKRWWYSFLSVPFIGVVVLVSLSIYWCKRSRARNANREYALLPGHNISPERTPSPSDNSGSSQVTTPQPPDSHMTPPRADIWDPIPSDSSTPHPDPFTEPMPVSPANNAHQIVFTSTQDGGGHDGLPQSIQETPQSSSWTFVHVPPTPKPSSVLLNDQPPRLSTNTSVDLTGCTPDSTVPRSALTGRTPKTLPLSVSLKDQLPQLLSANSPTDLAEYALGSTSPHSASTERMPEVCPPSTSLKEQLPQLQSASTPACLAGCAPDGTSPQVDSPVESVGATTKGVPANDNCRPSSTGVAAGSFLPLSPETIHKQDLEHSIPENRQNDLTEKARHLQNPGGDSLPPPEIDSGEVTENSSEESEADPNPP